MYPETSPTTPIEVAHGHTRTADDLPAARPCRSTPAKIVGYARTLFDPADSRAAIIELHQLGVQSENIYLDQVAAGGRGDDNLQLALAALRAGDTLAVASLTRLGRSVAALTRLVERVGHSGAVMKVGGESFDTLPPLRVLQLLSQFQIDLVDQAVADADWSFSRRNDMRHPHNQVDAVQAVWLHELYDAGMPRFKIGEHFGVSRATVFRIADPKTGS